MARFAAAFILAAVMIATASAQFDYFGGFPGGFSAPRDPRENRGPVTFPVTQPGAETSGVRVGASGYGFVPPGPRGGTMKRADIEEEEEFRMAAFQLARMTERERLGRLTRFGREKAESSQAGLRRQLEDSMARAEALARASLKEAERRLLLVMEKWGFGNWRSQ